MIIIIIPPRSIKAIEENEIKVSVANESDLPVKIRITKLRGNAWK